MWYCCRYPDRGMSGVYNNCGLWWERSWDMVKSHNCEFQNVEYLKLSKRSMLETGNTCKCLTLADEIFNIYKCLTLTTVKHFKPVEHIETLRWLD